MKPIKLSMQNAGPFRNEEIDFTNLDNMFLVCGNTGAGKTSIFDAITFALYGKLNGGRSKNSAEDFFSTYAAKEDEGFVTFKFEVLGKTYQITRTIPHMHTNRNGKETISNSTLDFGEVEKNGQLKSFVGKRTELDEKIQNLIGFSHEDFSKIVVLPQGQFSDFLKQKSSDRKETLSKLFNVDEYKAIVDDTKKQFEEKKKNATALQIAIESLLQKFNPSTVEDELKKIEDEIQETQKSLDKENSEKEKLISEKSKLEAAYKDAVKAEDNAKKLAELENQKSENEQKQKTITRAKEAQLYEDKILNEEKAKKELNSQREKLLQKESELEENQKQIEKTEKNFCTLCKTENTIEREFELQNKKLLDYKDAQKEQEEILKKAQEKENLKSAISLLDKEIARANKEFNDAQKLVESTESEIKTLEELDAQNEIQNASIVLIKHLKDKTPCPICGSLDHPAPFVEKKSEFNIKEKLEEKKSQLKINQKTLYSCNTQVATNKAQLQEKSAQLEKYSPALPDAKTAKDNCNAAVAAYNEQNNLVQTLTKLKKDFDSFAKENSSLKSVLEVIKDALESAKKNSANATADLKKALEDSPFDSVEECSAAMIAKKDLQILEKEFSEWQSEYNKYKTLVEKEEKCENSATIKTKITQYAAQLNEIAEKISSLENIRLKKQTSQKTLLDYNEDYIKKIAEFESMQKEIAPYENLFNDLSQHNPKKVSFDTWVLAYYFTEVVSYANKRFNEISQGRYEFKINDQSGGNGYKGLDLLVTDSYTGKERDTSTLSGGETFMASISLALALTDVVQNRNGGIQLDSIFIDEGFGTLDEETLNCAMGILNDLQETKMVGIISHIESMRTQIPSHIEVQKTMSGSHIKII